MQYLHTMLRVSDLESALDFYCGDMRAFTGARHYNFAPAARWSDGLYQKSGRRVSRAFAKWR